MKKVILCEVKINTKYMKKLTIKCKMKFVDSSRFISASLSNLTENISEKKNKNKCVKCTYFFEFEKVNVQTILNDNHLLIYNCSNCDKHCGAKFDEKSANNFTNTFAFYPTILTLENLSPYTGPELDWIAAMKMIKVNLELLTNTDVFILMAEKGISDVTCHFVLRYAKANNKYMKNYDEI